MIIHFHSNNTQIHADTHYRNGHETGRVDRRAAEVLMFGEASKYNSVPAPDMVKYGVFNLLNRPK